MFISEDFVWLNLRPFEREIFHRQYRYSNKKITYKNLLFESKV